MGEPKHTQGPWDWTPPIQRMAFVIKGMSLIAVLHTDESLAFSGGVETDEVAANVCLIAAAPDLLDFAEFVAGCYVPGLDGPMADLRSRAHAVIAKARGEAA